MPPKRKISEPVSTPEPKRRATRSSARISTAPAPNLPNDPLETEPKTSTKLRAPKPKKPTPTNATSEADKQPAGDGSPVPQNYTTMTMIHDLVKKPIQCHHYTPTPSSSTPSPTLIFTHGAGGTLSADAVVNFCTGFSTSFPVLAFQGSMNLKARTKGFHACIEKLHSNRGTVQKSKARDKTRERRVLLGGRSMGARAAVIAASEHLAEQGDEEGELGVWLVLVSYPLQGPKDDVRDQILLHLPECVGVLFIIGDRDAMCPLDLLNQTRGKMTAKSQLVVVRGADHGMHVTPASMTKDVGEETGRVAALWVQEGMEEDVTYIGEETE